MASRRGGQSQRPQLERVYGWFRCKRCSRGWESSHVYRITGTLKVRYGQGCKNCHIYVFPYKTEHLICSHCGEQPCECDSDDDDDVDDYDDDDVDDYDDDGDFRTSRSGRARHVDARKPHLQHLCQKCQEGNLCVHS